MKLAIQVVVAISLIISSIACTKFNAAEDSSTKKDLISYKGFNIDLKENNKLRPSTQQLVAQINTEQPVSFRKLTQEFLQNHAAVSLSKNSNGKDQKEVVSDFQKHIDSLKLNYNSPFPDLKVKIEQNLKKKHGKAYLYNQNHVSLFDIYELNKGQCYSGTALHTVVWRKGGSRIYNNHNPVIIYEDGHILPGFMETEGKEFRLIGIETTVSGKGRKDYGLSKDLNKALRVLDANLFIVLELVKFEVNNPNEILQIALQQTAEKYNIPLNKTEKAIKTLVSRSENSSSPKNKKYISGEKILNSSIGGFGRAEKTPENSVRATTDQMNQDIIVEFSTTVPIPAPEIEKEISEQENIENEISCDLSELSTCFSRVGVKGINVWLVVDTSSSVAKMREYASLILSENFNEDTNKTLPITISVIAAHTKTSPFGASKSDVFYRASDYNRYNSDSSEARPADNEPGTIIAHGQSDIDSAKKYLRAKLSHNMISDPRGADYVGAPDNNTHSGVNELGLLNILAAMDRIPTGHIARQQNYGWLVVFLSDENDVCVPDTNAGMQEGEKEMYNSECSYKKNRITPSLVYNRMKAFAGKRPFTVSGIINLPDNIPFWGDSQSSVGHGYLELIEMFNAQ